MDKSKVAEIEEIECSCGHVVPDDEVYEGRDGYTMCYDCHERELHILNMDSFDVAYERARVNGWED